MKKTIFEKVWIKINGKFNPKMEVYVIEFKLVKGKEK